MGIACKIESSKLTQGSRMMYKCHALTDWDSPLDNLVDGTEMFLECPNLTNFRANLKNLNKAGNMFYYDDNLSKASLAYIAGGLKDVSEDTSGTHYFGLGSSDSIDWSEQNFVALMQEKGWTVKFNSDAAPSYERYTDYKSCDCTSADASYWSQNVTNSLIRDYGTKVLNGVLVNYDDYMYCYIANEDMEIGYWSMASLEALEVWDADLPKLKSGVHMFTDCSNLHTFRGDLSSLECGYYMFGNTALTSWEIDLPSMKISDGFLSGTSVSSFDADLSSLVDSCSLGSSQMFSSTLTSFRSNLSNLKSGYNMFASCNLDLDSLGNISETIKDISSLDKTNDADWTFSSYGRDGYGEHVIDSARRGRLDLGLGFTPTFVNGGMRLVEIYDKGWTVYINGTDYTSQIQAWKAGAGGGAGSD